MLTLRPGEIIFVDLKPYPVDARGGWPCCFVAVDARTGRENKVDVRAKHSAGLAMQQIIVQRGPHKMSYKCTVFSDGCGT